jgi:hypothetical protein
VTGNQPGISRDGRVVAFYGVLNAAGATAFKTTAGPGIFAAVDDGGTWNVVRVLGKQVEDLVAGTGNKDGVCDPLDPCKPAPELGYDESGNVIYFAAPTGANGFSANANSRVGVTNLDLGGPGINDDTFVITFQGTPTQASRDNPSLPPGTPLLFSSALGLWTVQVDVERKPVQFNGWSSGINVYHSFGAVPVVQVGDRIGTHTSPVSQSSTLLARPRRTTRGAFGRSAEATTESRFGRPILPDGN